MSARGNIGAAAGVADGRLWTGDAADRAWPVRPWHLALLPAVLTANYLFMVARHEAAHGLVVLGFGGEIADVHLWPPRAGTLSWITFRLPLTAPSIAIALQAAAPALVAVAVLAAGAFLVCRRLRCGIVRANVMLAAVLFPCGELATMVVAYWYGLGDLFYVLGPPTPVTRWAAAGVGAATGGAVLIASLRRIWADGSGRESRDG